MIGCIQLSDQVLVEFSKEKCDLISRKWQTSKAATEKQRMKLLKGKSNGTS